MHIAVEKENIEIIKILLQRKELNVQVKDEILNIYVMQLLF